MNRLSSIWFFRLVMPSLSLLSDIADHHIDAEAAIRLYFSNANPLFAQRFTGYLPSEISDELSARVDEMDMRSALVTLARVEAALRTDYMVRCKAKSSDSVSIAFRKINKRSGSRARLDDDILRTWYENVKPQERQLISRLRGMLKFRHWLAHGRHWHVGTTHSFQDVYLVAELTLSNLPLQG